MTDLRKGFYRVLTVEFIKEDGTVGTIDGVPTWDVDKPDVVHLVPAADGMSCEVHYLAVGDCIVSVHADGDLGTGMFDLTASEPFTLLEAVEMGADSAKLTVGEEIAETSQPAEPEPVEPIVEPIEDEPVVGGPAKIEPATKPTPAPTEPASHEIPTA
jgi:hypothetical protein